MFAPGQGTDIMISQYRPCDSGGSMKLCRWGRSGYEQSGMIDAQGQLRDLSGIIEYIDQDTLSPRGLAKLRKIRPESLPMVKGTPRFGVPYTGISKIIGIGLNYRDHALETGSPLPTQPILFLKATTSINGPDDDVIQPRGSSMLDWEAELGVVIGTKASYVTEAQALDHVAGYTIVNDVSSAVSSVPHRSGTRVRVLTRLDRSGRGW